MSHFDWCMERVLKNEGGYSDHPNDSGGATNHGITQRTLAKYRGREVSKDEVRLLSVQEAKNIYQALYWDALNLDYVNSRKVAMILFDFGVNAGVSASAALVQAILGVKVDGKIGPVTLNAINRYPQSLLCAGLIMAIQIRYAQIVKNNPTQSVFIVGWIKRSHRLLEMVIMTDDV